MDSLHQLHFRSMRDQCKEKAFVTVTITGQTETTFACHLEPMTSHSSKIIILHWRILRCFEKTPTSSAQQQEKSCEVFSSKKIARQSLILPCNMDSDLSSFRVHSAMWNRFQKKVSFSKINMYIMHEFKTYGYAMVKKPRTNAR